MSNMDFFKVVIFILRQVLNHRFAPLKTWGLQPVEGHMSISRPEVKPGQQIDYEVGLFDPDF